MLVLDRQTPWAEVLAAIEPFRPGIANGNRGAPAEAIAAYEKSLECTFPDECRSFLAELGGDPGLPTTGWPNNYDCSLAKLQERHLYDVVPCAVPTLLVGIGPTVIGCAPEPVTYGHYMRVDNGHLVDHLGATVWPSLQAWYFDRAWKHWHLPDFQLAVSIWSEKEVDQVEVLGRHGFEELPVRGPNARYFGQGDQADGVLVEEEEVIELHLRAKERGHADRLADALVEDLNGQLGVWAGPDTQG